MSMYQPHPAYAQMIAERQRMEEMEMLRQQAAEALRREDAYAAAQQRADQINAGEQAPPEAPQNWLGQFINEDKFDAGKLASGGMKLAQMGMEQPAASAPMAPAPIHRPQGGQAISINPMQFQFRGLLA